MTHVIPGHQTLDFQFSDTEVARFSILALYSGQPVYWAPYIPIQRVGQLESGWSWVTVMLFDVCEAAQFCYCCLLPGLTCTFGKDMTLCSDNLWVHHTLHEPFSIAGAHVIVDATAYCAAES